MFGYVRFCYIFVITKRNYKMKEQANITNPNKLKETVSRKIKEDYDLRVKIANDVDMREASLYLAAYRNARSLENYFLIQSFKKHTGWDDEEIFQTEQIKA